VVFNLDWNKPSVLTEQRPRMKEFQTQGTETARNVKVRIATRHPSQCRIVDQSSSSVTLAVMYTCCHLPNSVWPTKRP